MCAWDWTCISHVQGKYLLTLLHYLSPSLPFMHSENIAVQFGETVYDFLQKYFFSLWRRLSSLFLSYFSFFLSLSTSLSLSLISPFCIYLSLPLYLSSLSFILSFLVHVSLIKTIHFIWKVSSIVKHNLLLNSKTQLFHISSEM